MSLLLLLTRWEEKEKAVLDALLSKGFLFSSVLRFPEAMFGHTWYGLGYFFFDTSAAWH
jgi:hypothetical protein